MNKITKFLTIAVTYSLVAACASTSDVENLQAQVNTLNTSVSQASASAANAQTMAATASAKAEAAEAAANRAAELSQETNDRLDRKFRGSMMK